MDEDDESEQMMANAALSNKVVNIVKNTQQSKNGRAERAQKTQKQTPKPHQQQRKQPQKGKGNHAASKNGSTKAKKKGTRGGQ